MKGAEGVCGEGKKHALRRGVKGGVNLQYQSLGTVGRGRRVREEEGETGREGGRGGEGERERGRERERESVLMRAGGEIFILYV
jgi:hypothetical protein